MIRCLLPPLKYTQKLLKIVIDPALKILTDLADTAISHLSTTLVRYRKSEYGVGLRNQRSTPNNRIAAQVVPLILRLQLVVNLSCGHEKLTLLHFA